MEQLPEEIEKALSNYVPPFSKKGEGEARAKVMAATVKSEMESPVVEGRVNNYGLAIAAAVVLAIVSIPFAIHFLGTADHGYSSAKEITLPDESRIILSSGATVTFNEWTWWLKRSVYLDGEAEFSVSKGDPFKVNTERGNIEVLGTVFTVREDDQTLLVHCKEGSVKVESTVLHTGEFIMVEEHAVKRGTRDTDLPPIAEMAEDLEFDRVPLAWLKEALEEHYSVRINLQTQSDHVFSGKLDPDDLNTSLQQVCRSLDLKYRLNRNLVVILDP